jgi:predicted DNA-binding transcriptional regulator YafY
VEPFHLLFYRANWYVLAIYNNEWRTFSLSRIEAVRAMPGTVKKVSLKRIRDTIDSAFGIFVTDQEHPLVPVRLRFVPEMARFARTVFFSPGQQFCAGANGCLDVSFPSTINRELIGEILAFGEQIEVLAPGELRTEICRVARETARLYGN